VFICEWIVNREGSMSARTPSICESVCRKKTVRDGRREEINARVHEEVKQKPAADMPA
jgi:hypothetical protein